MASSLANRAAPELVVLSRAHHARPIRPALFVQAALLLMIVGNLGRIPVIAAAGRSVPLLVNDLVVLALIAVGLIAAAQHRKLELDAIALIGIAFAILGGMGTIAGVSRFGLTVGDLGFALSQLMRWLLYFGVYIVVINAVRERDVDAVWHAFETSVLIFAGFGILQSAFLPGFAQLVYPEARLGVDWDVQGRRLVSTLLDPNFAGALIMMALLVQFGMMANGKRVALWKPLLLMLAIGLTASRSSLLGFGVGLAIITAARGWSKRVLLLFGIVAALTVAALPKIIDYARSFNKLTLSDASALGRIVNWSHGWTVFRDHPVTGIGFNTWNAIQIRYGWEHAGAAAFGMDGGLIFIAVLTGVVGVALYVAMMALAVWRGRPVWRNDAISPEHRGIAIGIAAITPAMVIHSLFTNSLLLPFLMEPLWVLWGLGFVIARAAEGRRAQ